MNEKKISLTLLISFAPCHDVSTPQGGGITLTPLLIDEGRCSCSSLSSLSGYSSQKRTQKHVIRVSFRSSVKIQVVCKKY